MSSSNKLRGKKALVTGSGTGIGREIALEFAREGADVVFHYSHSSSGSASGVEEAQKIGSKSTTFKADFNDLDEVVGLAEKAVDFLGGIDILVNNAGITFNKPFLEISREQFDIMFRVNIRAQFFLTQQIVKQMLKQGKGVICNLSSIHGLQGIPEHSVYAGTKGAIISYSRSLSMELAHKGIRVNVIAPGCVSVENHRKVIDNYEQAKVDKDAWRVIPIARTGSTLDIAKLAVFLCSDDAGYIVGQVIVPDGGVTTLNSLAADFRSVSSAHFGTGYLPGV